MAAVSRICFMLQNVCVINDQTIVHITVAEHDMWRKNRSILGSSFVTDRSAVFRSQYLWLSTVNYSRKQKSKLSIFGRFLTALIFVIAINLSTCRLTRNSIVVIIGLRYRAPLWQRALERDNVYAINSLITDARDAQSKNRRKKISLKQRHFLDRVS